MRFRRFLPAILGLTLVIPATPAVAGPPPQPVVDVRVFVNACHLHGDVLLFTTNTLIVKHRSAKGVLRKQHTIDVTTGDWQIDCPGPKVRTGDRLQFFRQGSTKPFRVFVVPELRLRIDRVSDVVRGAAPGDPDSASVAATLCDAAFFGCTTGPFESIDPTPGRGTFTKSVAENLTGTSRVELVWARGDDRVTLTQTAPRLVVQPYTPTVTGFGSKISQQLSLRVRRGQKVGTAHATTKADASFSTKVRRNGKLMSIVTGDVVSASFAGDAVMTVPLSRLEFGVDTVMGRCFKNGRVVVRVTDADGSFINTATTTALPDGSWSLAQPLQVNDRLKAFCANAKGDVIVRETEVI